MSIAIKIHGVQDKGAVARIADYIQMELAAPIDLDGRQVFTSASMGIVSDIVRYDRPADLLRDADMALYRAKASGRARHEFFDAGMYTDVAARWQSEIDLRQAVERHEFRLYYQPLVSLASGRITGVEALLRWQHPTRGMMIPDEFIPLAEETGLIEPMGEWVLRTACAQTRAWHTAGFPHLRVAVNVSARQFSAQAHLGQADTNLAGLIRQVLQETGLPATALELEIIESIAVHEEGMATLNELREVGIRVSLDDFGLGSSLDCLKRLRLNTLKIDQSFVGGLPGDKDDEVLVTAIIAMGHGLDLNVIAEGVETEAQLAFLRSRGCDEVQGNLFSPAVPGEALAQLLQERN